MKRRACIALMAVCAGRLALAQAPTPLPNWWATDGNVNAIAMNETRTTAYIGGEFRWLGPRDAYGNMYDESTGAPLASPEPNQPVSAVVADGAGGYYIGGIFGTVGGVARGGLARINANGTLNAWTGPLPSGGVIQRMVLAQGTLYLSGQFTHMGGQPRLHMAAIDATTGALLPFAPVPGPANSSAVTDLTTDGTTVYFTGAFSTIDGNTRTSVAAFDAATGALTAWAPVLPAGSSAYTIEVTATSVVFGGPFASVNGQLRGGLAEVDKVTGTTTSSLNSGAGVSGGQLATSTLIGNTIYFGGSFTSVQTLPRNGLAAFDLSTSTLTSWAPLAGNPNAVVTIGQVQGQVAVGGTFTNMGGAPRNCFALLDANSAALLPMNLSFGGQVTGIASGGAGSFYVAGSYTSVGAILRSRLAAIDMATGAATSWDPNASFTVNALAMHNGALYVGGAFGQVGGTSRPNLAAVDPLSGSVLPWNPVANGPVNALSASNGNIAIGGSFTTVGGQGRNNLAMVSTGGTVQSWNPGADGTIWALLHEGSSVYAGGDQSTIGGTAGKLVRVDATTGVADPAAYANFNGNIRTVVRHGTQLYVGGTFTTANGQIRPGAAAFDQVSAVLDPSWVLAAGTSTVWSFAFEGSRCFVGTNIGLREVDPVTGATLPWNPGLFGVVRSLATGYGILVTGTANPIVGLRAFTLCTPPSTFYRDVDADGFGWAGSITYDCVAPEGYVADNTDCDDTNASIGGPTALYADTDGDGLGNANSTITACATAGYVSNDDDCDDTNPFILGPQTLYADADGDSYGDPNTSIVACSTPGYVLNDDDCDDTNDQIIGPTQWFLDSDHDGWGSTAMVLACTDPGVDYVDNDIDCDDTNALIVPTEWCVDVDSDGHGDPNNTIFACEQPLATTDHLICDECNDDDASIYPGAPCNDGNANTLDDEIQADCSCLGTTPCSDVTFELLTDANGSETSWQVLNANTQQVEMSGSGYASNSACITEPGCLPDGTHVLKVNDAGSGFAGGYLLRKGNTGRIAHNSLGFSGTLAQHGSNGQFEMAMGTDRMIESRCDVNGMSNTDNLIAVSNPDVAALVVPGNWSDQTNLAGYEFWIFDPDGGYEQVVYRSLQVNNGGSGGQNTRARTLYLNVAPFINNPVPTGVELNVRVAHRINGITSAYGPACRFIVNASTSAYWPAHLVDLPGDALHSCGINTAFDVTNTNNRVYATSITGGANYEFQWTRETGSPVTVTIPRSSGNSDNNRFMALSTLNAPSWMANWPGNNQPQPGDVWSVRVRVKRFGQNQWSAYGPCCIVNFGPVQMVLQDPAIELAPGELGLVLWPNPNRTGQLNLMFEGLDGLSGPVQVELTDLTGRAVLRQQVQLMEGVDRTTLDLNTGMATGVYLVRATMGDHQFVERLVIE